MAQCISLLMNETETSYEFIEQDIAPTTGTFNWTVLHVDKAGIKAPEDLDVLKGMLIRKKFAK